MLLRALGFEIATYHLNEGHAALLPLALLRRYPQAAASPEGTFPYDLQPVRERCVFTTHTPVDAGHDRFDYDTIRRFEKSDARETVGFRILCLFRRGQAIFLAQKHP